MANPITGFMGKWLNTTYEYLKETGGPTYPASKTTPTSQLIPNVTTFTEEELAAVKMGSYSYLPQPFNFGNTGIVPHDANKRDAAAEIAHEQSIPNVISKGFGALYTGMMKACVDDQMHRHNNPFAAEACQEFAASGDISRMMLTLDQKDALGIPTKLLTPKPVDVQQGENKSNASLTDQMAQGVRGIGAWGGSIMGAIKGGDEKAIFPAGIDLKNIGFEDITSKFPKIFPSKTEMNIGTILMVGGAVLLLILLIRR